MKQNVSFFDVDFSEKEQLPRIFSVTFEAIGVDNREIKVTLSGSRQLGSTINDNAYKNDFYRYHDIFHYSFATLLGWSPCSRAMMMRKRKSKEIIDEIEDGARAAITEEALSMIIFNEAKRKNYFKDTKNISRTTLRIIKEMTENFEVNVRSAKDWENAILKAYDIFRQLIAHQGGKVDFDAIKKTISYSVLPKHNNLRILSN